MLVEGLTEGGGGQPTGRSQEKWEKVEELLSPAGVLEFLDLNSSNLTNMKTSETHKTAVCFQEGGPTFPLWRFSGGELSAVRVSSQEPDPTLRNLRQQIVLPGVCFILLLLGGIVR